MQARSSPPSDACAHRAAELRASRRVLLRAAGGRPIERLAVHRVDV